jgi:hypothetical protein
MLTGIKVCALSVVMGTEITIAAQAPVQPSKINLITPALFDIDEWFTLNILYFYKFHNISVEFI